MIRSKYQCVTPKIQLFLISHCFKKHIIDFCFVFVLNCVLNLCTCSLLHEISSLTQLCIFKQCKMKNTGISGVALQYLLRIIFSHISRWLLLVSVILQISNLEAILYLGHFFIHPVELLNYSVMTIPVTCWKMHTFMYMFSIADYLLYLLTSSS